MKITAIIFTLILAFSLASCGTLTPASAAERFLDACAHYGIEVEHELHAIDWLLPRTMFATAPSFFRMNAKGARTPDSNCCPSNPFALEVIACRAVEAARVCRSTTGRYFYWMTDNGEKCNCPKCLELQCPYYDRKRGKCRV